MTAEHKNKVLARIEDLITMLILPVVLIVLWQVLSTQGVINASILPSPARIGDAFKSLYEKGTLFEHIWMSCLRVLEGFLLGVVAGTALGAAAALSRRLNTMLTILIGVLRPIPAIALIPFLILWFGIGEASKVAVIFIGAFWPILLNTIQGIQGTDEKLIEVGKVFGKSNLQILTQIVLPSALPAYFTGLRLGISSAWVCVVAAEMIAASKGLGYLVSYGREMSQPAVLMVGIVSIGVIGLLIEILFLWLQRRLIYWNDANK